MKDVKELVEQYYQVGVKLKKRILKKSGKKHVLKCIGIGTREKLINAPAHNDPGMFIEAILEMCQSYSLSVPKELADCMDENSFGVGSRAFICGLFS